MSVAIKGTTYTTGAQVTATNLNALVDSLTFASGAVDNSTTQLSGGAIIVKDAGVTASKLESASNGQLMIGTGTGFAKATLTAGYGASVTNASGSITIGASLSRLNSNLSNSVGVTQAGASGADLVFNASNAPTVNLTVGTWLVIGSVCIRTSDNTDNVYARFRDTTDGADFGGGASVESNATFGLSRLSASVVGVYTVASGTKAIYFKGYRTGTSSLDMGNDTGPSGHIEAVRIA